MCPLRKVQIQQQSSTRSWSHQDLLLTRNQAFHWLHNYVPNTRMARCVCVLEDYEENNFIETIK